MEVKIKEIIQLSKETSIFSFLSKNSFKLVDIMNVKMLYPCQNIKLSFYHKSIKESCVHRYYSLINNPFHVEDFNEKSIEFQMLIKENISLSNSNDSLPNIMKRFFLNNEFDGANIEISYPFGSLYYLGNGEFMYNSQKISAKIINLICCGTGVAPIKQLISALEYENNLNLSKQSEKYSESNSTQVKINLVNITKPEANYFHEDFVKMFEKSTVFSKESELILLNKTKSKSFNFSNYSLIFDDYYGDLAIATEKVKRLMSSNCEKDEFYFLCGTENMLSKISSQLCDHLKITNDKLVYFY